MRRLLPLLMMWLPQVVFAQFMAPLSFGYWLELEEHHVHEEGELAGMTTYRLHLHMVHESDYMSAISGAEDSPLEVNAGGLGFYNHPLNAGPGPHGIVASALALDSLLQWDSYLTVGFDTDPASIGTAYSVGFAPTDSLYFQEFMPFGEGDFITDDYAGGACYALNPGAAFIAGSMATAGADLKVLCGQFTTFGQVTGGAMVQIFPQGVGLNNMVGYLPFCPTGECGGCANAFALNYDAQALYDDGSCLFDGDAPGCTDALACNFDPYANVDDGSCGVDIDDDGICDDVDACIGEFDACGVCNGPGEIYACGCFDLDEQFCNCSGEEWDALGVCGGDCAADLDNDGICDDVDECLCGTVDALGVCGGGCLADDDNDGVCDDWDDGMFPPDGELPPLVIEEVAARWNSTLDGMRTYRVYFQAEHPLDYVSAVAGSQEYPWYAHSTEGGFYNHSFNAGWGAQSILEDLVALEPDLVRDSYLTLGFDQGEDAIELSSVIGSIDPFQAFVPDGGSNFIVNDLVGAAYYHPFPGLDNPDHPAFAGEDLRVLLAQITTPGELAFQCQIQVFREGNQQNAEVLYVRRTSEQPEEGALDECVGELDECGVCNGPGAVFDCGCSEIPEGDCDCEGTVAVWGCTNPFACNFDFEADACHLDDGSCEFETCQWCNDPEACNYEGEGFAWTANPLLCEYLEDGACDCDGNVPDALGECGGSCLADVDDDGICDSEDPCIGQIDACGICNGPGAIQECGCFGIPVGDCDCDGNQLDAVGECGGECEVDADEDGICDDVDPCVGVIDECGLCNGPGAVFECGCTVLLIGTCDCDGNELDAIGVCGGTCVADVDGDGVCDSGCNDLSACNFNPLSSVDDGSCEYAEEFYDCEGGCLNDTDGDGVCDELEIYGCTNPLAMNCCYGDEDCGWNFNPEATEDDGSCLFPDPCTSFCLTWGSECSGDSDGNGICDNIEAELTGCTDPGACNFDWGGPLLCFDDGSCEYESCQGCLDDYACNYDPEALFDDGSCAYDSPPYDCDGNCYSDSDGDGVCDELEIPGCTDAEACNYAGTATDDDGSCLYNDALGNCGGDCLFDEDLDGVCDDVDDCVGSYDACGVCNGPGAIYECGCMNIPAGDCDCDGNQLDALGVCGGTCPEDLNQNGICDSEEVGGCTDPMNPGFNPEATYDDGSCLVGGCLIEAACNYDASADYQLPGACEFETCQGCTDPESCNYNPDATIEDGSCEYPSLSYLNCEGDCLNDSDGDGVCDEDEVLGCTDPNACNFDESATDHGDCEYCEGCNDPGACNFDPGACNFEWDANTLCFDDGTCEYESCQGCLDDWACNYDPSATIAGECDYCFGCINAEACNYDANATEDDGSCEFESCVGCTDPMACNYNSEATDDDGSCTDECYGCMNALACNFDCLATVDDESCLLPDPGFDCDGNCWDLNEDGICDDLAENLNVGPIVVELDTTFCGPNTPNGLDQFDPDGELEGYSSYLVYLELENPTDVLSAVFSDTQVYEWAELLQIDAPEGCWNPITSSMVMDATNNSILWEFPPLAPYKYDTFWTIGMTSSDAEGQLPGFVSNPGFGGADICEAEINDGAFFATGQQANNVAGEDLRILIARVTTPGNFEISGNAQVFVEGDEEDELLFPFHAYVNAQMPGCTDSSACNYNPSAWLDDGTCLNFDAIDVCGGDCAADTDNDGICDDVDDCVGALDECGICNGPGAIYECGCSDIPAGDCDCDGNQLDVVGVCGGTCIGDIDGDGICDCYEETIEVPFAILDEVGECNQFSLHVSGAPEEATVEELFVNMEHSFLGDLDVIFICPSGVELQVAAYPGPGTSLGEPVDDDADPFTPGVGYDYAWNADPTYGTWADEQAGPGGSLPAGSYTPVDDWSVLEECPVNGVWQLVICDFWASDNGFLFDWGVQIAGVDYPFTGMSDCEEGCTDALACNFNVFSSVDDGSCEYPGDACDDGDDTTINDALNEECECVGEVDGVEEAAALTWTLYPSPVRDVLNLRIESGAWSSALDGDVEVMVLDATGQVLRSERLAGRTQFDVSDLASGIYFLTLRSPAMATTTRRFVVAGGE